MKKRILSVIAAVVLIPILIWVGSLIKCEVLTNRYYDDFALACTDNPMLDPVGYFKVLSCDDKTAQVYYVSVGRTMGNVLTFEKRDGTWVEIEWDTIWSASGNADEIVYPYWWHFFY